MERNQKIYTVVFLIVMLLIFTVKFSQQGLKDIVDETPFKNKVELNEAWTYDLKSLVVKSTYHNGFYYFVTDKSEVVVLTKEGRLHQTFPFDAKDMDAASVYPIIVDDKYIFLNGDYEVLFLDVNTGAVVNAMKLENSTYSRCMNDGILYYEDFWSNKIMGINIKTKEIVLEFSNSDEPKRDYSVYTVNGRLFIKNSVANNIYELDVDSYEIISEHNQYINNRVKDGEYEYVIWKREGIVEEEILKELGSNTSNTLSKLPDGRFYVERDDIIKIFDSNFKKLGETQGIKESLYGENYLKKLVFGNRRQPLSIYDPNTMEIIWRDDLNRFPRDILVNDEYLIIAQLDGLIRCISGIKPIQ
jgi:hypothetical protein